MDELAHYLGIDPVELQPHNEPDVDPRTRADGRRRSCGRGILPARVSSRLVLLMSPEVPDHRANQSLLLLTGSLGATPPTRIAFPYASVRGGHHGQHRRGHPLSHVQRLGPAASFDPDGTITAWKWSSGGTVLGTGKTLNATLGTGISKQVTLTVTDNASRNRNNHQDSGTARPGARNRRGIPEWGNSAVHDPNPFGRS